MPDPQPIAPSTLGQRIDALLGPLETEAHQYREAIELGREQVLQMQTKIDMAEQALSDIEIKMTQILDSLATNEPMLARAMGREALPTTTAATAIPTVSVDLPVVEPEAPACDPAPLAGADMLIEQTEPEAQVEAPPEPTPQEDEQAVQEINDLLNMADE